LLVVPSGILSDFIGAILERLTLFSKNILEHLAQLPFAAIKGSSLNSWQVILIYTLMLSFVFALTLKKKKLLYISMITVIALSTLRLQEFMYTKNNIEFRFHNVNRNLAIAVFKKGEYILYADSLFATTKGYSYLLENIKLEKGKDKIKEIIFPD